MAWGLLQRNARQVGKYEILGKLGAGGGGAVYKARDPDSGQTVAIKVLDPEVAKHPRLLGRFRQEFLATHILEDPHIVRAIAFDQEGQLPYLVMEYVEGTDLWERISTGGRLPEAEAVGVIRQIARGLHHAHEKGLIHRDVKPDNILLTAEGVAKLTDFGLVKDLDSMLNLTQTGTVLGTPNFMAPEQFENPRGVDRRCDVYALAATLYMAVTGEVPFYCKGYLSTMQKKLNGELPPPRQVVPELSERLEAAILRAMQVQPYNRTTSCLEFLDDIDGKSRPAAARNGTAPRRKPNSRAPGSTSAKERRSEPRYGCSLNGECHAFGAERRTRWKAKVRDVSAMGIGVVVSRRFEPGTILLLDLVGGRVDTRLVVRVMRVQEQSPKEWVVGCKLACRMKRDDLLELRAAASDQELSCRTVPMR